jgi:glycosyltransferase involved in cell wall biosynthesis
MRVAVLVPCFNEALTIAKVVADFRGALPDATVHVFDNNSTDDTARIAEGAGAVVDRERRQGKGFVMASMLEKVDADAYVLVDGDDTYPAERVHDLLRPVLAGDADQVVGARKAEDPSKAYRPLHTFGNRLVTFLVNRVFGTRLTDVMSGYRAFNRGVARNVPFLSGGFDVETEFTLQCLEKGFTIEEIDVAYRNRPKGSVSKLSTFRDGFRVLRRILLILKDFRPFVFFGTLAVVSALLSLLAGWPAVHDYIKYRYVYHVPLAVLAGFLGLIAVLLLAVGTLLATFNARVREIHALARRDRSRVDAPS